MAQAPTTEQHRPKHRPKRTGRGRGGGGHKRGAQGQRAKQSAQQRWWATLPEAETDPISLEPLAALAYPPFSLRNAEPEPESEQPVQLERMLEKHPKAMTEEGQPATAAECRTLFDGRVLAHYLVSTLVFQHPITRRELGEAECKALDAYLVANRLGRPRVLRAFARKDEPTPEMSTAENVVDLQAESAALLRSLFAAPRRSHGRPNMAAMRNARRLQAAVLAAAPAQAEAAQPTAQPQETALLVRSESHADPDPTPVTTVTPRAQQLREQTNAFPALGESTAAKAKGSWCAPVHAVASKVDVAKDFPTLGGGAQPAQPSRAQRRWGAAGKGKAGRSGPLTMAMIMESR